MKTRRLVSAAVLVLAGCGLAQGATRIKDNLTFFELKNGMKVFVYPRQGAPVFSGMIYVDAGSAEEQIGETGLAHLLEHMAFKGTPWIGTTNWNAERKILQQIDEVGALLNTERQKGVADEEKIKQLQDNLSALQKEQSNYTVPNEYDRIITHHGAQEVNATTDVDYTNYFMSVPTNKLELWAMMESERLVFPAWREFYQERDVVAEERRMRTEDTPTGKLWEEFLATSFRAHPYRMPTIGWMPDLYNLTIAKMDAFYKRWYVPENIIAVLVGDVKVEEVRPVMEKYFGTIPARPSPAKAITVEPPQRGEKRLQVMFDAQPQIMIGWHKPTFPDRDMYVCEVIQFLLSRNGRSSRLYERLVKRDGICQEVEAFTGPGDKYPNLFILYLTPRAPHTNAEAEKTALEEIERLKNEPIGDEELQRTRNQIDAQFLKELEGNLGFARKLGYYYIASRDPDIIDKLRDEMKSVTPQDIQRVAQKYLTAENRTVGELVTRSEDEPGAPKAGAPATMSPTGQPVSGMAPHDAASTAPGTLERSTTGSKAQTEVSGGVEKRAVPAAAMRDALTSAGKPKAGGAVEGRK
ncbi:MAG: M16 family metallopeptidase [Candidatus Sumerlaeaceae bacterium]